MSLTPDNILLNINNSSLKILKEASGTVSLDALGASGGSTYRTITIAHGYSNDNLLWQVAFNETDGNFQNAFVTPFEANDGSLNAFATLDGANLYINIGWQVSTSLPVTTFDYIYRILIP